MSNVYLAFYHGRASKITDRLVDSIIRTVTQGEFSHVELAILRDDDLFDCCSSSLRDRGVRMKTMSLTKDKWKLVRVNVSAQQVIDYYQQTKHLEYDITGALSSCVPFYQNENKLFCSEWVYNAITGTNNGWRFNPVRLHRIAVDVGFNHLPTVHNFARSHHSHKHHKRCGVN